MKIFNNHRILSAIFHLAVFPIFSLAQESELYDWGFRLGGPKSSDARFLLLDTDGNMIVSGRTGDARFSKDYTFIKKFSKQNELLWESRTDTLSGVYISCISLDKKNNIVALGGFEDSMTLGGKSIHTRRGPDAPRWTDDIFFCKYSPDGNMLWLKSIGTPENDFPVSITADSQGSFYVWARFKDTLRLGDNRHYPNPHVHQNRFDVLIKFDSNGKYLWSKASSGNGEIHFYDFLTNQKDELVLYAVARKNAVFEKTKLGWGEVTDTAANGDTEHNLPFVMNIHSNGNIQWTHYYRGFNPKLNGANIGKILESPTSDIITFSRYTGNKLFISPDTIHSATKYNYVLMKSDNKGKPVWAKLLPNSSFRIISACLDQKGHIYLKGYLAKKRESFPLSYISKFINTSTEDVNLLAKFDQNGDPVWSTAIPSPNQNFGDIQVDPEGNLLILGGSLHNLIFGADTLNLLGAVQLYIARLNSDKQKILEERFTGNWLEIDINSDVGLNASAYFNGTFFIGGPSLIYSSKDSYFWSDAQSYTNCNIRGFGHNENTLLAGGSNGEIIYSSGGKDWSDATAVPIANINDILWSGSTFWAAGANNAQLLKSNDGRTWSRTELSGSEMLYGLAEGNGTLVAVGADGAVYTSTDDFNWAKQEMLTEKNLYGVAWNGNVFAAVGDAVSVSSDGIKWRLISESNNSSNDRLLDISSIDGKFLAVGREGRISVSSNGEKWNHEFFPCNCNLTSVAIGDRDIVITHSKGKILTSKIENILLQKERNKSFYPIPKLERINSGLIKISFYLPGRPAIGLAVCNIQGKHIPIRVQRDITPGKQICYLTTENFPRGLYILNIHIEGKIYPIKFLVNT